LEDKPGEEREDIRKRISRFDDEIHSCLSLGASKRLISTSKKFIFLNQNDVNPVVLKKMKGQAQGAFFR
jgi:hypothetical protein